MFDICNRINYYIVNVVLIILLLNIVYKLFKNNIQWKTVKKLLQYLQRGVTFT